MKQHGVFISHRHEDWMLAGRIYDLMTQRGLQPFLDADSMRQGNFHDMLEGKVRQTPYFLLLLTKNTFRCMDEDDWIYKEVVTALDSQSAILLLAEEGFAFPEQMPAALEPIRRQHFYTFSRTNFLDIIRRICELDIKEERLEGVLDWRNQLVASNNCYLTGREHVEKKLASLEARFGVELVAAAKAGVPFEGKNRVRFVHMACYAASIILSSDKDMVDERAYDLGTMFNIFSRLLEDDEFSLEMVITAPGTFAVQDAIDNEKLGNSSLEAYPEAVFLGAYCNLKRLIEENPVFKRAKSEKRFRFMVTENVLPYALFQMGYKKGWEEYDHIKVDLYSEGLTSSMDRRSMTIFRQEDKDNFDFFVQRYEYIRNVKESRRLIKANEEKWLADWAELQEEME